MKLTDLESAAASMITVDRAVGDLRRGEFVLLEGEGGVALAQAAETVSHRASRPSRASPMAVPAWR